MSWTKGLIVSTALSECGVADYEFDLTSDERQNALRRLDAMMAMWEGKGIALGYRMPSSPDESDLSDPSGLPDAAIEPVYLNLARRIAPGLGKTLSVETVKNAREGYDQLLSSASAPLGQKYPDTLPYGAGNKSWRGGIRSPFFPQRTNEPIQVGPGGGLEILSE